MVDVNMVAITAALFFGVLILAIETVFVFNYYVMKACDKKIGTSQLILGVVIGVSLVYPGVSYLMESDIVEGYAYSGSFSESNEISECLDSLVCLIKE